MNMNSERGSALLVALVLIFMLSAMGVSAMRGSTMEMRMANNAVQTAAMRQAAESAADLALSDVNNLNQAWNAGNEWHSVDVPDVSDSLDIETPVSMRHSGDGLVNGFSAGSGGFMSLRFVTRSEAMVSEVNAIAGVEQGSYRIVPNPNN